MSSEMSSLVDIISSLLSNKHLIFCVDQYIHTQDSPTLTVALKCSFNYYLSSKLKITVISILLYLQLFVILTLLQFIIFWVVCPSVRTRQLALFINLGMLELTYRVQTLRHYSFSS